METTNTSYDANNTIYHLTNMIGVLEPSWVQQLVIDIYINDIEETHYKGGLAI